MKTGHRAIQLHARGAAAQHVPPTACVRAKWRGVKCANRTAAKWVCVCVPTQARRTWQVCLL